MIQDGFYLVMKNEDILLTEVDINSIISEVVGVYEDMYNEIEELKEASKLNQVEADKVVRKRYKDFIIN